MQQISQPFSQPPSSIEPQQGLQTQSFVPSQPIQSQNYTTIEPAHIIMQPPLTSIAPQPIPLQTPIPVQIIPATQSTAAPQPTSVPQPAVVSYVSEQQNMQQPIRYILLFSFFTMQNLTFSIYLISFSQNQSHTILHNIETKVGVIGNMSYQPISQPQGKKMHKQLIFNKLTQLNNSSAARHPNIATTSATTVNSLYPIRNNYWYITSKWKDRKLIDDFSIFKNIFVFFIQWICFGVFNRRSNIT